MTTIYVIIYKTGGTRQRTAGNEARSVYHFFIFIFLYITGGTRQRTAGNEARSVFWRDCHRLSLRRTHGPGKKKREEKK